MSKYTFLLVFLFIEVILEVGIQLESYIVQGLSVKNVFIYGLFMLIYVLRINTARHQNSSKVRDIHRLFLVFILYAVLATLFSSSLLNPESRYKLLPGMMSIKSELVDSLLAMLIFYYISNSYRDVRFVLHSLVIVVSAASALTLVDVVVPGISIFGFDDVETGRPRGAFGEPNQTAAVLALYAPLVVAFAITAKKWKMLYVGCVISVVAAIVSTGSRGGIVATTVGMWLFLFVINRYLSLGKKALIVMSIPLLFIAGVKLLPSAHIELLVDRFSIALDSSKTLQESSAGRTMLWNMAYGMWQESPLLGQGWGAFRNIWSVASHNVYLDYLISVGFLGTVIILTVWYKILKFVWLSSRCSPFNNEKIVSFGILSGIIAFLVAILFVNLYKPWLFVWAFVGVALAYANQILLRYKVEKGAIKQYGNLIDGKSRRNKQRILLKY